MLRRCLALLTLFSLMVALPERALASPDGQSPAVFVLGFRTLADHIGGIAGVPLENEWHGPNGDGMQRTTTGLMVWRKSDNWTAFTDGASTWVNGPFGVQVRPNGERFDWETDGRGQPAGEAPAAPPTSSPASTGGTGYYVSPSGSDSNSGALSAPFKTVQKAANIAVAGDTIFLRAGEYPAVQGGYTFRNSGTATAPITLTNYPGEQAIFRLRAQSSDPDGNYYGLRCWNSSDWLTPQANYIHILGTKANGTVNGVGSDSGLVFAGAEGQLTTTWAVGLKNCQNWEIAGVDFIQTGAALRTKKQSEDVGRTYFHDNRVYTYTGESGVQVNDDLNRIENNKFYRVDPVHHNPYGCQAIDILGHGNVVKGNLLDQGSSADIDCKGVLFEWDAADNNVVESNVIHNVREPIVIAAGDGNVVRNNIVYRDSPGVSSFILISRSDGRWPCDHGINPCYSDENQILSNTTYNYRTGVAFYSITPRGSTTVKDNVFVGATALFTKSYGGLNESNNATSGVFVNPGVADFHPATGSSLLDVGAGMGAASAIYGVPGQRDGGYDVGAYGYKVAPRQP